jgi:signal peptidase II
MDPEKGQETVAEGARTCVAAWIPAAWALLVVAADQAAKAAARATLSHGSPVEVVPGLFNLTLVFNEGAAWGMFGGFRFFFIALAIAMLAMMNFRRRQLFGCGRLGAAAFALLEGGIVGNVIDRVAAGRVTDFIDLYHGTWHFPCFNIADSAICIGVALYFILAQTSRR